MLNLINEKSDVSRSNQVRILDTPEVIAEKLRQYLHEKGKGIDVFPVRRLLQDHAPNEDYIDRDRRIRKEVKKRLGASGQPLENMDIQYFLAESGGESYAFFLTSNRKHTGWIDLFKTSEKNQEKIINLVFKLHLISQMLPFETINGFEELLIIHKTLEGKGSGELKVWGHEIYVHLNRYQVLSINLSRKCRLFEDDHFHTLDGDGLGNVLLARSGGKRYSFKRKLDGRKKNTIDFMRFDSLEKFRTTQLYYYQKLMDELESFLSYCGIGYTPPIFQADAYLENPFVDQDDIDTASAFNSMTIINNTGEDFSPEEMAFLQNFFTHQGLAEVQIGFSGQTVSKYELVTGENDDDASWKIMEAIPWSSVQLHQGENYLVFNKILDEEEASSMAYQRQKDGLWLPSSEIEDEDVVDFYSNLKRRYTYVSSGAFFCMQGVNVTRFTAIAGEEVKEMVVMRYSPEKVNDHELQSEARQFTDGLYLDAPDMILAYLRKQTVAEAWHKFCQKHKIKVSAEFKKILSEMKIKSWIRVGLIDPTLGLPVAPQQFPENTFWSIYVSSPWRGETKAVAVKFLFKNGQIFIQEIMTDRSAIQQKFRFLRTSARKTKDGESKLFDNQQYFADEEAGIFINCYTAREFTPILIGRPNLIADVEAGNVRIDRTTKGGTSSRILPLVMYYNPETAPIKSIQDRICVDSTNKTFIQYFVPPKMGVNNRVKRAFRVYHLYGYTYQGVQLTTQQLLSNPIVALHFNTLTQNVLKIGENSQSSLLQKVARVLVEN
ncbi:MAG: hypothetical protein ACOYYS_06195 [Chloroflexota bacterium]